MTDPCTCDNPCCSADIGVGVIDCGTMHCPTHGTHQDEPACFRCGVSAEDLAAYDVYRRESESRSEVVRREEGTYNPDTGTFACDACYIAIGWPTSPYGWKAPERHA